MPKGAFKRIFETLTSGVASTTSAVVEHANGKQSEFLSDEFLSETNYTPCKTVRQGFPHKPSVIGYDPVQKLLAVGCDSGSIRIFGQAGVDCFLEHETGTTVLQLMFLASQGALISVCANSSVHLWNLRQKKSAILHSLNFKRESITFCHLPHQSSWIYIGTDKGNTYVSNIETFTVSGYAINWNKAIDVSQKTHPGAVITLSENPVDENKLLILFETGSIVLWNLKNQVSEQRFAFETEILSTSWHSDGKRFICSHPSGCLTTWECGIVKPIAQYIPHANSSKSLCSPIDKVQWLSNLNGNDYVIFSGGLPATMTTRPSVTVMRGRSVVTLEVGSQVVDFTALSSTPWSCDFQDAKELAILTENDLMLVDLETPGYPRIEPAHPMDIHDSNVTCLKFFPDPNTDLIPGLYQVASGKRNSTAHSKKDWPIRGGEWSVNDCNGLPELIVTGHADGCVRFWDASAAFLRPIYKLRTKKIFKLDDERTSANDDPYQINHISLCPESRTLVIANGSSAVVVYKLSTQDAQVEIDTLDIRCTHNLAELQKSEKGNPAFNQESASDVTDTDRKQSVASSNASEERGNGDTSCNGAPLIRLKNRRIHQSAGFQTDLACFLWRSELEPSASVTSLTINTSYQLLACGTASSIYVVDMLQKICLFNMCTAVVLKSIDKRIQIKSPSLLKPGPNELTQPVFSFEQNNLKSSTEESDGKSVETKTKWKTVTKKSRNTTKSIGDYFSQSRSILHFRRSSLLPKSVTPSETPAPRASSSVDISVSSPEPDLSPDPDVSPDPPEEESEAFESDEVMQASNKIKFVMGDDGGGKADSDCGLRPDSVLSRGSNASDIECQCAQDFVSYLSFASTYTKQSDRLSLPCLWVGTSGGFLFSFIIHLPNSYEQRSTESTVISPSGSLIQTKGGIVHCNFLDSSGHLISAGAGNWRDHACPGTITVTSRSSSIDEEQSGRSTVDKQFMVVCSEQQAKVFTLPSQACIRAVNFNTTTIGPVVNASVDATLSDTCLACVTLSGHIVVYNLPSLNLLLESPYLPTNDTRIANTLCFGVDGQIIYMPSPSEIQRMTYSVETFEEVQEFIGHLFVPRKSPERPSIGFLNGLFGGGYNAIDRNEIFGASRASRAVADHVPGSGRSSLLGLRPSSGTLQGDVRKLQMQLGERGDKLTELEDKSERMNESAMKFANDTNALMMKYRDKKWYQI